MISREGLYMETTTNKKTFISTIFVALFIVTDAINLIATRTLPLGGNFMTLFYAITGIGIILTFFLNGGAHRLKMRVGHFVGIITVTLFYAITYLVIGGSSLSLSFFVVFVLLPMLIPVLAEIDVKVLLRVIFVVPSFGILRASSVLLLTDRNAMTMGDCYALLIPIIAALTYMMIFFRTDSQKTKLLLFPSITINLIYYIRIVMYGSRGPILSVILCFVFLSLFRENDRFNDKKRIGKVLLFALLIALFMLYFWEVLQFLARVASSVGINIRSIDKIYMLRQATSIWNGRDNIVAVAIQGIQEKPILGHGISTFQKYTGIIYPHNFILQVLYDGGVILFAVLIVPLIVGTIKMIKSKTENEFALFSALFFASVPGALFSGDCWKNGCLWLLIGMMIAGKLPARNREIGEM